MPANLAIALLHYPVYNKRREIVTTALTNLDLHDIARSAKTFGLFRFYVVTPAAEQRALAERIGQHWLEGWGATYNPKRKAALELMKIVATLDDVLHDLEAAFGRQPRIVVTGAQGRPDNVPSSVLAASLHDAEQPYLLVFGTGWGLADEVFERADLVLEPISGTGDYNHLSVRSAAAIILDRLLGQR